jgi:hypothetical protein
MITALRDRTEKRVGLFDRELRRLRSDGTGSRFCDIYADRRFASDAQRIMANEVER